MERTPYTVERIGNMPAGRLRNLHEELIEVDRQAYGGGPAMTDGKYMAIMTNSSAGVLVARNAEAEGTSPIVGFLAWEYADGPRADSEPSGSYMYIYTLVVLPTCHRSGIGKQLLKHFMALARPEQVRLHVRWDNIPAMRLYLSAGFQFTTARKDAYAPGMHALMMAHPAPAICPRWPPSETNAVVKGAPAEEEDPDACRGPGPNDGAVVS